MNLMFIQGGSRLKKDNKGNWYTDGNFTPEVWKRYLSCCDELTVILRKEDKVYDIEFAEKEFCRMLINPKLRIVDLPDIIRPKMRLLNLIIRKNIRKIIESEVASADKVIIRSCSLYTYMAYKACLKYNKPYLMEVTGFAKEGMTHHSLLGRILAGKFEQLTKELTYNAECATYVTQKALQERYPCKGKMLGCSDVQLPDLSSQDNLTNRLKKINSNLNKPLKIGTAAFLDVKWKGQAIVIRALKLLKENGYSNIEYEMVGLGTGKGLKNLAKKLGVENQVKIIGACPHDKIFEWMDSIDVYVQSSYQEGLCRSIVEAMSCACPVICSDTGGNYELIDNDFLFRCGDSKMLSEKLLKMMDVNIQKEQATKNFEEAKNYQSFILNKRREAFLKEFIQIE